MSKQVTIFLARRVTLNRAGHDAVELQAGRNLVDADVAAHPFIKAHTVDAGPDNSGELDELRARVAELVEQLNTRAKDNDALRATLDDALAELTDARALLAANAGEITKHAARATDLEEQLAQKSADMDALVASMTPPAAPAAETKHAKVKA